MNAPFPSFIREQDVGKAVVVALIVKAAFSDSPAPTIKPERIMSRGLMPPSFHKIHLVPMCRYNYPRRHSKLEGKKTHPVDCRATSPTTQERDSLKSQGRGWPRGPTWRLGISAGNAKVATSRPADRRKRIN